MAENEKRLLESLDRLVEPTSRGDSMSPLRWTCKSTRKLATQLFNEGLKVSHTEDVKRVGANTPTLGKRLSKKFDLSYLQVLPPTGPLQLPEQHSPSVTQGSPLAKSRQSVASASWSSS